MKKRNIFKIAILGLLSLSLTSCFNFNPGTGGSGGGGQNNPPSTKIPVQGVYFELEKTSLDVGETTNIKNIVVTPSNATNSRVYFTVDDQTICKVENLTITAVGYGSTFVNCISVDKPSITSKVKIDVVPLHVKTITLSLDKESVEVGEIAVATLSFSPANALNKEYTIVPNFPELVEIDGNLIKGKKTGLVTLKAQSLDNGVESQPVFLQIKEKTANAISLSCAKTSLEVGETAQLVYKVLPENVIDKDVAFKTKSGNSNVISVSSVGVVTAKGDGEDSAVIYMRNKPEVYSEIKFIVVSNPVTSITLAACKTEIESLETVQLYPTVLPENATDKSVGFKTKSGNSNVISVSSTGLVKGVNVGTDSVVCYSIGNPEIKVEREFRVKETEPGEITVPNAVVNGYVNGTHQINATVLPINATDKNLSYEAIDRNDYSNIGESFNAGEDYTYKFNKPVLLNEKIVIDIRFNENAAELKISLMLGQGWNQYFGYFNLKNDGTLENDYVGVTTSEPSEGIKRFIFDLSKLTKVSDKPVPDEYIDMIYIRGQWTGIGGNIVVNPEIKNDILSVNNTGLVTFNNIGEQKVKVFLTNHPSISKEITFKVTADPKDPVGEDIYDYFN